MGSLFSPFYALHMLFGGCLGMQGCGSADALMTNGIVKGGESLAVGLHGCAESMRSALIMTGYVKYQKSDAIWGPMKR
jgi:hypothetical protein